MQNGSTCHELEFSARIDALLTANPELKLFGLIDGTVENPVLDLFFQFAPEASYEPLFLATEYESCLPFSPYLIEMTACDEEFLTHCGHWADSNIVWWLSPLTLEQQAEHWRSLITVVTPELDTALFRFWNGKILDQYLTHCSSEQRDVLLAPCQFVLTPHDHRLWQVWNIQPPAELPARPASAWWHIQPEHLTGYQAAFERMLADEIEDTLWRSEPTAVRQIYPSLLPPLILQGMEQASALGLQSSNAITEFLRCQFRFGWQYWASESLKELWSDGAQSEGRFLEWARRALA